MGNLPLAQNTSTHLIALPHSERRRVPHGQLHSARTRTGCRSRVVEPHDPERAHAPRRTHTVQLVSVRVGLGLREYREARTHGGQQRAKGKGRSQARRKR